MPGRVVASRPPPPARNAASVRRAAAPAEDVAAPCLSVARSSELDVQRVQPSYVQVAEQLRDLISRGDLAPGYRLPPEAEMAPLFGVSRSTIREALRILSSEGLVVSRRGVKGGTFVLRPEPARVDGLLSLTLNMLVGTNQLTSDDFLEAWVALEAPAAQLAARRRVEEHVEDLRRLSDASLLPTDPEQLVLSNINFHNVVMRASGNVLLEAMARPVSAITRARFRQTSPTRAFWARTVDDHRRIAEAIADKDEARARDEMTRHIEGLRPYYRKTERGLSVARAAPVRE